MTKSMANPARRRLLDGELSLGMGIRQARGVDIAKLMKTCGYDWLFLDLEHNVMSLDTAAQIAVAALDAGITPIARVPHMQHWMATRFLDNGGLGIVMPHVNNADEARAVVEHLRYPPLGHRSVSAPLAQFDFKPQKMGDLIERLNAATLLVVMLESPEAVEQADDIAAVDGIDVLLVGTSDLSAEMGIPGEIGHERIGAAYDTVLAACQRHGKWLGMGGVYDHAVMQRYIDKGARFILSGGDVPLLIAAATQRSEALRQMHPGERRQ